MTATLLSTLPGDIPGLLRRWPTIVLHDTNGISGEPRSRRGALAPDGRVCLDDGSLFRPNDGTDRIELDLSDSTGRAHAAWWARRRVLGGDVHISNAMWAAIGRAEDGLDMTPEQIDTLARLVLRLAGRTP